MGFFQENSFAHFAQRLFLVVINLKMSPHSSPVQGKVKIKSAIGLPVFGFIFCYFLVLWF